MYLKNDSGSWARTVEIFLCGDPVSFIRRAASCAKCPCVIYNPFRDYEHISSVHNFCRGKKLLHQSHAQKLKQAEKNNGSSYIARSIHDMSKGCIRSNKLLWANYIPRDITENFHNNKIQNIRCWYKGTAVAQWLRCCATNRKVAGSISDDVIGIFPWHNPSDRTMALASTQPLTEKSTRSISWG